VQSLEFHGRIIAYQNDLTTTLTMTENCVLFLPRVCMYLFFMYVNTYYSLADTCMCVCLCMCVRVHHVCIQARMKIAWQDDMKIMFATCFPANDKLHHRVVQAEDRTSYMAWLAQVPPGNIASHELTPIVYPTATKKAKR
jgi:hypothetical protein